MKVPIWIWTTLLVLQITSLRAQTSAFDPESIVGEYELTKFRKTAVPGIIPRSEVGGDNDNYYVEKGKAAIYKAGDNRYGVSIIIYYANSTFETFTARVAYKGKLTTTTNVNNDGTVNSQDCSCAPCIGTTSGNYCAAFKAGSEAFNFVPYSDVISQIPWVVFDPDGENFTTVLGGQTEWRKRGDMRHYHQLTKNPLFEKRTIMSYGPLFRVCADGSDASIFKVRAKNLGTIRIKENPTNSSIEAPQYGQMVVMSQNSDSLLVRYKHPTNLPLDDYSEYKELSIELTDAVSGTVTTTYPLWVYRAPVLMVHGLWADSTGFETMENALRNNYSTALLKRANYSKTNNRPFAVNQPYISKAINELISQVVKSKIATGKVDYVAHSMGGILGRLYLQSDTYREDLHKLITLNTPHAGSQVANEITRTFTSIKLALCNTKLPTNTLCNEGALDDLRVDSDAIRVNLNNSRMRERVVPSHALATTDANPVTDLAVPAAFKLLQYSNIIPFALYRNTWNGVFFESHDFIVALSSQLGGLQGQATTVIPNQLHIGASANPEVIKKVKILLNADVGSSMFSLGGFNPPVLDPPSPNSQGKLTAKAESSIRIVSPAKGQVFTTSPPIFVSVTGSNVERIRTMVVHSNDSLYLADQPGTNFSASVRPNYNQLGKKMILAMGKNSAGEVVVDVSYFYLIDVCASKGSGNWGDPYNWFCGHVPTIYDQVILGPGHVLTVSTSNANAWQVKATGTSSRIRFANANAKLFIMENN